MAMVESALGAVPMLPSVGFLRAARRTHRASFHATGSPLCLSSGGVGQNPGIGDLGAATPVSGDRDLGEVEQLDPHSPRVAPGGCCGRCGVGGRPSISSGADHPVPHEVFHGAHGVFSDCMLEVVRPAAHDLVETR